ncbi:heavy-metal-associated domain-containing protein [Flavobacterium sp. JP2137]|uniref:heavy-metal-associated domain-containing protein n=1 Tax=Flavobacterium sp. JP2137 TaxID=3414510 RepID=UPI003D2FB287
MKNIILATIAGLLSLTTFAQEKPNKNAKETIAVKGNCEMCKKRIEKAAFSVKGVRSAVWFSDNQQLELLINETKTDAKKVQKAIAEIGHDTEAFKAEQKDYDALHGCCQYPRE